MKLVFLGQRLAPKAMGLPGGMLALYRFEPHNFGPFSPEVLSDLEDLESKGLIEIKEQPLDTEGRVREYRYRITGLGREFLMRLEKSSPELTAIRKSIDPFIGMPRSELVDFVYSQYPDSVK
ncbi:MAG TPA: hypothetical protein VMG14_05625 [Thermoplasmata archaeon]|nr:hypothetical protein [Thermoplasmata archaeon]